MVIVVYIVPNENFSLSEQLQEAIGPFADMTAAIRWVENDVDKRTDGGFYDYLSLRTTSMPYFDGRLAQ